MTERPYPVVNAPEELFDLPTRRFLEVAGSGHQLHLSDGDDPLDVARKHVEGHPRENRFRLVRLQRFTLGPDGWREEESELLCGVVTTLADGVEVRCGLEPHRDGVDHGGHVRREGRRVGVHYWRTNPAITP